MSSKSNPLLAGLPLLIGGLIFVASHGLTPLNPCDITWFSDGDAFANYLGWAHFRNSPWSFPPGMNYNYGLELGNSIVFTDSNPPLAIFFKLLSPWLPHHFQYLGWWLCFCFMLQCFFGWKILSLYTTSTLTKILGSCLFCFSFPFIQRAAGHFTLAGHFLVLAAVYLTLSDKNRYRFRPWAVLLCLCISIHPYIFCMDAILWGILFLGALLTRTISRKKVIFIFLVTPILCYLCGYMVGVFAIPQSGGVTDTSLFGISRFNLWAPFDSNGWSILLRDLPVQTLWEAEGFNYLGIGYLFLCLWSVPVLIVYRNIAWVKIKKYKFVLIACALLTLYAASNKLGIGPLQMEIPLPEAILNLLATFRSSGRLFWPVYYFILVSALYFNLRYQMGSPSRALVTILLSIALFFQAMDTRQLLTFTTSNRIEVDNSVIMQSDFWKKAAKRYKVVRSLPFIAAPKFWQHLGLWAYDNNMATDMVLLGRYNRAERLKLVRKENKIIKAGEGLDQDALYIVPTDKSFKEILKNWRPDSPDFVGIIDGYRVVAPGWKEHETKAAD